MAGNSVPTPLVRGVAYALFAAAALVIVIGVARGKPLGDMAMDFILAGLLAIAGGGLLAAARGSRSD